jgi:hypothetical protein
MEMVLAKETQSLDAQEVRKKGKVINDQPASS